jgi:hypothetical protein
MVNLTQKEVKPQLEKAFTTEDAEKIINVLPSFSKTVRFS